MQISKEKLDKIKEEILRVLYTNSPQMLFTCDVAREVIRDEEFIKRLLNELEKYKFVVRIKKNPQGIDYTLRSRWRLSTSVYDSYKKIQENRVIYDERNNTYT